MATRTISTRLAIEGEAQYKQAIANINRELKTLTSEMKLVESQFKGQANSVQALEAKHKTLVSTIEKQNTKVKELRNALENARSAQNAYAQNAEVLEQKLKDAQEEMERLGESTEETGEEQEQLAKTIKELSDQLETTRASQEAAAKGTEAWQTQLNNAEANLNDLNRELEENDRYLDEARNSVDHTATSIDNYGKKTKEATAVTEQFGEKGKAAIDEMAQALAAAGVAAAVEKIAEALWSCIEASNAFESAMAGVAKTTDLSGSQLSDMGEQIKNISLTMPLAASEFANIAEAAGQLGISKNDIIEFSTVMANLGVATNMSATEAATALARFSNVVGTTADDYERLGSTIVALGNSSATTEAEIVEFATRLASTGALVGLSEAEILALSAAMSSLGIEAEAGGTAMSKLLQQFETMVATGSDDLVQFAEIAGMTVEEFKTAWGKDAVGAVAAFIDGLAQVEAQGGSSIAVLGKLDITEARMSRTISSLATGNETLTKSLETANKAWEENTALAKEAETRYETTESRLQIYKNSVENLQIAIGDKLNPALRGVIDLGTDINVALAELVGDSQLLVPIITGLVAALGVFTVGVTAAALATTSFGTALKTATTAMTSNPIMAVVTAVVGLGTALYAAVTAAQEAEYSFYNLTEAARGMDEAIQEADEAYKNAFVEAETTAAKAEILIQRLEELEAQGLDTAAAEQEYHATLELLVETIPELADLINLETNEITGGTAALRENTKAWKENLLEQAKIDMMTEKFKAYYDVFGEVAENQAKLTVQTAELEAAQGRVNELTQQQNELYQAAVEESQALAEATGQIVDPTALLGEEYANLTEQLREAEDAQQTAQENINSLNEAIAYGNEAWQAAQAEMEAYSAALEELMAAQSDEEAALEEQIAKQQELAQQTQETGQAISEALADMAARYENAYSAAKESIYNTIGAFQHMEEVVPQAVNETIAALQSQVDYMNQYAENIKKAMEMGVDQGLVGELADGSVQSAGILAGIVAAGEGAVDDLNGAFYERLKAADGLATEMADAQTDFQGKLNTMTGYVTDFVNNTNQYMSAYDSGVQTAQGYIDGLNSRMSQINSLISQLDVKMSEYNAKSSGSSGTKSMNGKKVGTYAEGLEYVPYDDFPALLHKGERVLTAAEARMYNAVTSNQYSNTTNNNSTTKIEVGPVVVYSDSASGSDIADSLARELRYRGII